jgi:glycosyltransferase involved in cell wall biosynthesis
MTAAIVPFASVIVPVRNGERTIGDCVASLVNLDYPADRREILVVDNGSTDRTAQIVKGHSVRYLREEQRGASRARNRGIAESRGDIIAFTDADCVVTRGWLAELVSAFEDSDVGGVAGEILAFPPRTPAERYAARIGHLSPRHYLRRPIFPFAVTANLAFRRGVFDRIGPFDPGLPRGGEGTDFCTTFFRHTDLRLALALDAVILHRHRTTARGLFEQQWSYGRGHAFLYIKYGDELVWSREQTAQVYRDLAGTAAALVKASLGHLRGKVDRDEVSFQYFELVRKVALRLGFARESIGRGYLRI